MKYPLRVSNRCIPQDNESQVDPRLFSTPAIAFRNATAPTKKPTSAAKIFQIGFNKCATQSLYTGFKHNNISAVHYGSKGKTLAATIYANMQQDLPLLRGIDQYLAYFDMEDIYHNPPIFAARDYFRLLDKQYPGSKFIFNTRDKDKWIQSRLSHEDQINGKRYVDVLCAKYKCTQDELVRRWSVEWDVHHEAVREYFKDRPDDMIEYNLDTDAASKLCAFFPELKLDAAKFHVVNKTPRTVK